MEEREVKRGSPEDLEARGLYRRAAAGWTARMMEAETDGQRAWLKQRRDACLERVRRPVPGAENFRDVQAAATATLARMGLTQVPGEAFRAQSRKKHHREGGSLNYGPAGVKRSRREG